MAKSGYVPKTPSKKAIQQYRSYLDQLKGVAPEQVQEHSVEVSRQMGLVHDQNEDKQTPSPEALIEVQDILSPHARSALDRILGKPKDLDEDYLRKVTNKGA